MKKLVSLLVCTLILSASAANAQSSDRPRWNVSMWMQLEYNYNLY